MSFVTVIALIFNFGFGITLLVYYFSNFKTSNSYIKYGSVTAAAYAVLTILSYCNTQKAMPLISASGFAFFMVLLSALKVAVYTCTGFFICSKIVLIDMPLMRRLFKEDYLDEIDYKKYIIYTSLAVLSSLVLTILLFKLTSPEASDFVKRLTDNNVVNSNLSHITFNEIFSVLAPVIPEEIIFRLIFPNFLYKSFHLKEDQYWIVIAISAAFWAFCHSNTLDPEWVKLVQIFPIGLFFGALYKKFGLESSIIAHGAFNFIMIFLTGSLIKL